jgi:predicted transcriptional regulator YheO
MFRYENLPELFELLGRIAEGVVATVGPDCEVVVHDLRDPEHTVVAIAGNLTRRMIGSPAPDPDLLPGNVDRFTEDQLRFRIVTPFGKELLASTIWIRDTGGHIVGAVCINMDFANLRLARDLIDRSVVDYAPTAPASGVTGFATTAEEFAGIALQQLVRDVGKPLHQFSRDDKIGVVRSLDQLGVFSLRGAADTIAEKLGVSRASVYSYLKDAREEVGTPGD